VSGSTATVAPRVELDHLVVACRTLDAGRDWCEAVLGVSPAPGGRHALMGTHNLLLALSSPRFPRAYLELIAIDPDAPAPGRPRWFELDEPALQGRIAATPELVHWVARTREIEATVAAWRAAGFDPGAVVAAERMTPRGWLRWRIAIAPGGRRPARGAVPLLIEWGDAHPTDALPESGLALRSIALRGVDAVQASRLGLAALTGDGDAGTVGSAPLAAMLSTPRGEIALEAAALWGDVGDGLRRSRPPSQATAPPGRPDAFSA
jgi:hypothetical protein